MKEPAILPVSPPHTRLRYKTFSGFKRCAPLSHERFHIFRVDRRGPSPPKHLHKSEADIFQPAPVEEVDIAIRQRSVNKRRSGIYQMAILALAGAQLLLRAFTLGDIDHSTNEFNEL